MLISEFLFLVFLEATALRPATTPTHKLLMTVGVVLKPYLANVSLFLAFLYFTIDRVAKLILANRISSVASQMLAASS